ncbi:MAG: hypothetical protein AAGK97_02650 [Bacteroidota bacterium]
MNNQIVKNIIRFIVIVLLQVLILQRIDLGWEYLSLLFYPLFLILLPFEISRVLLIIIGFVLGCTVDIFYDSMGVHASASVFTAFARPYVLKILEPANGYPPTSAPTKHFLGLNWFLIYSGILLFAHIFFYFSVEVFTYVYFLEILLKTIVSFVLSYLLILIHHFLFNPK